MLARSSGSAFKHRDDLRADHVLELPAETIRGPYLSSIVCGAASTVLWHARHLPSVMRNGRARYSIAPVALWRSPISSFGVGVFAKMADDVNLPALSAVA